MDFSAPMDSWQGFKECLYYQGDLCSPEEPCKSMVHVSVYYLSA